MKFNDKKKKRKIHDNELNGTIPLELESLTGLLEL